MTPEEQAAFDAREAEKKELGISDYVDPDAQKSEESEDTEKESDNKKTPTEENKVEDESEDESEDDSDESDEDDLDEESDDDEDHPPKKVSFKEYKKELRQKLQADFDQKLEKIKEEFQKKNPNEEKADNIEEDIKSLAKDLGLDEEKTKKLILTARKGLEVPKELLEKVEKYDKLTKDIEDREFKRQQESIFNGEWGALQKQLKEKYPNATDEQITKAKAEMDKLAHNETYHDKELDYVLFKESKVFDKILYTPNKHTFETGRPQVVESDSGELPAATPENLSRMTPAQFEQYQKARQARMDADSDNEKMLIRSTDGKERWE